MKESSSLQLNLAIKCRNNKIKKLLCNQKKKNYYYTCSGKSHQRPVNYPERLAGTRLHLLPQRPPAESLQMRDQTAHASWQEQPCWATCAASGTKMNPNLTGSSHLPSKVTGNAEERPAVKQPTRDQVRKCKTRDLVPLTTERYFNKSQHGEKRRADGGRILDEKANHQMQGQTPCASSLQYLQKSEQRLGISRQQSITLNGEVLRIWLCKKMACFLEIFTKPLGSKHDQLAEISSATLQHSNSKRILDVRGANSCWIYRTGIWKVIVLFSLLLCSLKTFMLYFLKTKTKNYEIQKGGEKLLVKEYYTPHFNEIAFPMDPHLLCPQEL